MAGGSKTCKSELNACSLDLFEKKDCLPHCADEGLQTSVELFLIFSGVNLP